MVVARVLVVRDIRCRLVERELAVAYITGNGIEARLSLLDGLIGNFRLQQDMAALDFVAALVNELDDVIAEFRLNDFRYFLLDFFFSNSSKIEHF